MPVYIRIRYRIKTYSGLAGALLQENYTLAHLLPLLTQLSWTEVRSSHRLDLFLTSYEFALAEEPFRLLLAWFLLLDGDPREEAISTALKIAFCSLVRNPGVSLGHRLIYTPTIEATKGAVLFLFLEFLNEPNHPFSVLLFGLLIFLLDFLEYSYANRLLLALLFPKRLEGAALPSIGAHCLLV